MMKSNNITNYLKKLKDIVLNKITKKYSDSSLLKNRLSSSSYFR